MMIEIKIWKTLVDSEGRRVVEIICPTCNNELILVDKKTNIPYYINHNGVVTPSVIDDRCGFHDFIKLINWEGFDG